MGTVSQKHLRVKLIVRTDCNHCGSNDEFSLKMLLGNWALVCNRASKEQHGHSKEVVVMTHEPRSMMPPKGTLQYLSYSAVVEGLEKEITTVSLNLTSKGER